MTVLSTCDNIILVLYATNLLTSVSWCASCFNKSALLIKVNREETKSQFASGSLWGSIPNVNCFVLQQRWIFLCTAQQGVQRIYRVPRLGFCWFVSDMNWLDLLSNFQISKTYDLEHVHHRNIYWSTFLKTVFLVAVLLLKTNSMCNFANFFLYPCWIFKFRSFGNFLLIWLKKVAVFLEVVLVFFYILKKVLIVR